MDKGYIQIYTGNGKGKTTASMGLTLRALGAGFKVCFCQFVKKGEYSEIKALRKIGDLSFQGQLEVKQFGIIRKVTAPFTDEDKAAAAEGIEEIKKLIDTGKYNLIVLDEINIALHYELVSLADVLNLMHRKPEKLELVFTGRYAKKEIIKEADLVTIMGDEKHYADKGVPARRGIEM